MLKEHLDLIKFSHIQMKLLKTCLLTHGLKISFQGYHTNKFQIKVEYNNIAGGKLVVSKLEIF